MPNISDVARYADVSVRTVSRVLNDDPLVRPRTRRQIMEAIEALEFIPNQAARSLRKSSTRTIGVVLFEFNSSLLEVVPAIEEVVRERGYSLLVCDSQCDPAIEAANLRRLYEHRVEGVIVFVVSDQCPDLALFAKHGTPTLAIHSGLGDLPEGVGQVLAGRQDRIKPVLKYLAELGHRRVALVQPRRPPYATHTAPHAMRGAFTRLGLEYDPALLIACERPADCVQTTIELLSCPDRPTAIFSLSHALCPHILEGIEATGLAIPNDLSFVTTGDSPWARAYRPSLTAQFYDIVNQGRLVGEYIFSRIEGQPGTDLLNAIGPVTAPRLVLRRSCAPPQGNVVGAGFCPEAGKMVRSEDGSAC